MSVRVNFTKYITFSDLQIIPSIELVNEEVATGMDSTGNIINR